MEISFPQVNFELLLPSLIVLATAMVTMLLSAFTKKNIFAYVSLIGLVLSLLATSRLVGTNSTTFGNMFVGDDFSLFFNGIFLIGSILTILMSIDFLRQKEIDRGEFYPLVLFATYGMMVMASSANLVVIFIGLEIMSVALYVLAGFARRQMVSTEASIKYFLLGAFATGFTVFGIAFTYGATGTFDLYQIVSVIKAQGVDTILLIGAAFMFAGLGFKIAVVPFHMWAPDVYEGAPSPITGFMSAGPKAAAFAALIRIFTVGLVGVHANLESLFWILAVLTMTVGNIMAIRQGSIKRMLAYSSIAHAGYVMIALTVGTWEAASAAALYLLCYAVTNLGAFIVISHIDTSGGRVDVTKVDSYTGLARKHPYLAIALTICMISLAGFPSTAGFIGKFTLFKSALTQGFYILVIAAVFNSLISVYYYLRVVVKMFMAEPDEESSAKDVPAVTSPIAIALFFAIVAIFLLGLYPQGWFPFDGLTIFAGN